jgi:hypothetical protein
VESEPVASGVGVSVLDFSGESVPVKERGDVTLCVCDLELLFVTVFSSDDEFVSCDEFVTLN